MKRRRALALLLTPLGMRPCFAARRRGAKIYPDKETAADMSSAKRIFLGWIDFREDDWVKWGYSSKAEWADVITALNTEKERLCQTKYLTGRTVSGAKSKGDENAAGNDLYIKFTDVQIDYDNYHLVLALHFLDPKTNSELGSLPARAYFGNDWGFAKYLMAALGEVGQKIKVEVAGPDSKKTK